MSRSSNSVTEMLPYIFGILLGTTVLVWVLRGFGVLTFVPGSAIWMLMFLSVATGIAWRVFGPRGRY
ncbi:MAG: hypothetical protein KME26_13580 [Oscillatoria princeps RMCB-10]|nr:hypothetical protein [Oscillatoria princeps RMCB-10]